jgi:hypothetical protein
MTICSRPGSSCPRARRSVPSSLKARHRSPRSLRTAMAPATCAAVSSSGSATPLLPRSSGTATGTGYDLSVKVALVSAFAVISVLPLVADCGGLQLDYLPEAGPPVRDGAGATSGSGGTAGSSATADCGSMTAPEDCSAGDAPEPLMDAAALFSQVCVACLRMTCPSAYTDCVDDPQCLDVFECINACAGDGGPTFHCL